MVTAVTVLSGGGVTRSIQPLQPHGQNTNTNKFILHRIKNNKTLATSYFSMINIYNIIQLFTIKINLKHYTYQIDIMDLPMLLTLF